MKFVHVRRIFDGWRFAPPTHRLVAAYMKIKTPDETPEHIQPLRDLKAMFPDGVWR